MWQYLEIIGERLGIHVSISTLHCFLKKHKITLEKRLGYWHEIGSIPAEAIVAVDETGSWEGMEKRVARSLEGEKLIGAISVDGIVCYKIAKGSVKKQDYVQN